MQNDEQIIEIMTGNEKDSKRTTRTKKKRKKSIKLRQKTTRNDAFVKSSGKSLKFSFDF